MDGHRRDVGTGQRESTIEAGYTTACASHWSSLSVRSLHFGGVHIRDVTFTILRSLRK